MRSVSDSSGTVEPGLVSVVLPVRFVNFAWLERSIRSVLEQDYADIELIVVNDATTENIDALVARLGVTKYIKNNRNLKLPASLNRGFASAQGEFHTWTSADNYMRPGMISALAGALNAEPAASIVCGPQVNVNAKGDYFASTGEENAARLSGTSLDERFVPRPYLYYGTLGACFLYTREVTDRLGGYDEALHGAEDYDFWIRASRHFNIVRLPPETEPLYAYRMHPDSISSTLSYCYSRMRAQILHRELEFRPDDYLQDAYRHHLRLYRQERLRRTLPVRAARGLLRRGRDLSRRLWRAVFGGRE